MAFEKMGLGGIITVDTSKTVKDVGRARDEFGRFVASTDRVPPSLRRIGMSITSLNTKLKAMSAKLRSGTQKIGTGLRNIAMGAAPLTLALAGGINQAVQFEKQMSTVGAVTLASAENMRKLEKEAKRMGIVSVFSATENAQAQEFLGRAGANTAQILSSLQGVVNAAAADELDLATATDIVTTVVKGMGRSFGEATHIADVLALASASAKTNIRALGESFTYGVTQAKQMGLSVEETTAILAKMADAGLKGSMAGTTFSNMMIKMSKRSKKSQAIMDKWNIQLEKSDGSLHKVSDIVAQLSGKLAGINSVTQKSAILQEMFGIRGGRAMGALMTAGKESLDTLEEKLKGSSEAFGGLGAAAEMARRRLDNVWGASKLLMSSLEGLSISLFKSLMGPMKGVMKEASSGLNSVLFLMDEMSELDITGGHIKDTEAWMNAVKEVGEGGAQTALQVAMGFRQAADTIGEAWNWVVKQIKAGGKWLKDTFGEDGITKLTKFATLFMVAAAAIVPVIVALGAIKFVVSGIISVISGMGTVLSAVFWPVLIAVGAVLLAYQLLKKENESFMETATRVWGDVKTWILDVWENAIKPLWQGIKEGFTPAINDLGEVWNGIITNIKLVLGDLYTFMFGGLSETEINWKEVGRVIGAIIGALATAIGLFIQYAIPAIASIAIAIGTIFGKVWDTVSWIVGSITIAVANVVLAIEGMFSGNILSGLARLGTTMLDMVLFPIRSIVKGAIELAKVVGIELPKGLQTFAEEGVTGLVFGAVGRGPAEAPPKIKKAKNVAAVEKLGETSEKMTAAKAKQASPEVNANVTVEDKKVLNIENKLSVSGEDLNIASGKHRQEINDRAGFKTTPYQRRAMMEHGAVLKAG